MKKKPFYITSPIYYPSANLHLGNTYTSIICDATKRYKQEQGYDCFYVTGSDEHGEKLATVAAEHGKTPLEYIDPIVESIRDLWKLLDVEADEFVRSTSQQHEKDVQEIFTKLHEKGDIYKGVYKGYYCTPCEAFWSQSQLVDHKCPDCGRDVHYREEESYFFRLSKYQDKLLEYYQSHPEFIKPDNREKEMVGSFFKKEGLKDLSVTRKNIDWGVKVPFDEEHVIYVWIDALICYLTGIGYGSDKEKFNHYWPAGVHFIGRDIARFHVIIWPAILMALGMELPKQIFAHGWILFESDKMSKSKGNVIYPEPLIELYGRDALKYFVLKEFNFGSDGNFVSEKFLERLNSDLANDLGNLLSRTLAMVEKYQDGLVLAPQGYQEVDKDLMQLQEKTQAILAEHMEEFDFQRGLESIWQLIRRSNKYIDETKPWQLGKEDPKRLQTVLYRLVDSLRTISILLRPFIPETVEEMYKQLNLSAPLWDEASQCDLVKEGHQIHRGDALFPRLDIDKELKKLHEANDKLIQIRVKKKKVEDKKERMEEINFADFLKVKLRVGEVTKCENHPNADKLLVETVDFGDEVRTVVSGIRDFCKAEDLIGKKFVFLYNLAPKKIRGIESQGMILVAEDGEGQASLVSPLNDVKKGSYLS